MYLIRFLICSLFFLFKFILFVLTANYPCPCVGVILDIILISEMIACRSHELDWDSHRGLAELRPGEVWHPAPRGLLLPLLLPPHLRAWALLPLKVWLDLPGRDWGRSSPPQIPRLSQTTFHWGTVRRAGCSSAELPAKGQATFLQLLRLLLNLLLNFPLGSLSCSFSLLLQLSAQR